MNNLKKTILFLIIGLTIISTVLLIVTLSLITYDIWVENIDNFDLYYRLLITNGFFAIIAYTLYKIYNLFY